MKRLSNFPLAKMDSLTDAQREQVTTFNVRLFCINSCEEFLSEILIRDLEFIFLTMSIANSPSRDSQRSSRRLPTWKSFDGVWSGRLEPFLMADFRGTKLLLRSASRRRPRGSRRLFRRQVPSFPRVPCDFFHPFDDHSRSAMSQLKTLKNS